MTHKKILFVCLGNICRSPIADGIMRSLAHKHQLDWEIDSAGTGSWHSGEAPDKRAQHIASVFGVDISHLVARQFKMDDFDYFDQIFAMDSSNYSNLIKLARNENDKAKVDLILNQTYPRMNRAVPDPWYDDNLFEPVFKMLEEACLKILEDHLKTSS